MPFAILAPSLDKTQAKLLRVALAHVDLPFPEPLHTLPIDAEIRHVLSAGKDALDVWHDFGLIRVGANHGDVFTHVQPTTGRRLHIMVIEHPGAMQQLSMTGHEARDRMIADLGKWARTLTDLRVGLAKSRWCGGCLKMKDSRQRPAEFWIEELDMVGLCDDHWRKRAQYKRKVPRVAKKDKGKMEHQMDGQIEAFPGDGTRLVVSKG